MGKPIYLTNTLGRELQQFDPLTPGEVKLYTCGVTVYNHAHIGNMRTYIFSDILRRVLGYNGYTVHQVRNITDVGHLTNDTLSSGLDKIEAAARAQHSTPWDIATHFTELFQRDARALNIEEPEAEPRATQYIPPMIQLVERLIATGHAYAVDGNVYYDVSSFPPYGKLSGNSIEDLIGGHRVEVGEDKKAPADFALWKAAEPDRLMRWESPWGDGVPGWHLECSAMAMDLLGEEIDIHTGGVDHIFPHHEDEIAQSEGATGEPFARYWLHGEFLQIGADEKMSKSLGNIFTLDDLAAEGIHPLAFRLFTFNANYRTKLNFTWDALWAAQTTLIRLWEAVAELTQSAEVESLGSDAEALRERFHTAINNDLDMPIAVAVLHEVLGSKLPAGQKLALIERFDRVLGLDLCQMGETLSETTDEQADLLHRRAEARTNRDWAHSDALRTDLASRGLDVKDTPQGQRWVRRDLLPPSRQQEA
jgi:cysteinyl-tRNA synthetase